MFRWNTNVVEAPIVTARCAEVRRSSCVVREPDIGKLAGCPEAGQSSATRRMDGGRFEIAREAMSIVLDGLRDAGALVVENSVEIARAVRCRAHCAAITASSANSRSRCVFVAPRAFCEAVFHRGRGESREEV